MKLTLSRHTLLMLVASALVVAAWHFGVLAPDVASGSALTIGILGQMTPAGARVVDPVLTTVARGYKSADFVAEALFPVVPVGQRGGKIISFNRDSFRLFNTARAPGANTTRVQFGYAGDPYALEQHRLEALVPVEPQQEAAAVPGIDLARISVASVQEIIARSHEVAAAAIATSASNYDSNHKLTLMGTDKWSAQGDTSTSDPVSDIANAVEAVRASTGLRPNTVLLSAKAFAAARRHPKVLAWFNQQNRRQMVSVEDLAAAFGVKQVVVGEAVYFNGTTTVDIWGGDAVVAFTQIGTLASGGLPSYGYTYRLTGYPLVEAPYHDRNANSWVYPVTDERAPVLASAEAGFLVKGAA